MRATHVTVFVPEDTALRVDAHVSDSGAARGWLSLGAHHEVSLWGSPGALSRLAVGLLGAANAAERVSAGRASAAEREAA
jgi:hypothetical protein